MHRNDPEYSPILWWQPPPPQKKKKKKKISSKSSYPKNIHFSENPQNIEIQNFEPQKMTQAYVCVKISEYPPPPPPPPIGTKYASDAWN